MPHFCAGKNVGETLVYTTPTYGAGVVARLAIGQFQFVEDDVMTCPVLAGLWRLWVNAHSLYGHTTSQLNTHWA